MATPTPTAAVRNLLKAVRTHLTKVAGNTQWRDFIVQQARQERGEADSDPQRAKEAAQLADDLAFLIRNISHHKALLHAYNLGVNPDDRNKQMVEAVAKRVGFRMPDEERLQPRVK